ncbi:MAG: 3-phosphoshikimate 1-carboxyvinyltransferase [Candidatus Omnitrophica bacterium]|nr:3-phosphoshikimate 1-carboxyvinyltransferase [Candidatus Omnitrophota bacterium]
MKSIEPVKRLCGEIRVPGDKSISHRAVMLGAISEGRTSVEGLLDCDDCLYTIRAFREMGVAIETSNGRTTIDGAGLRGLKKPKAALFAGESGTTMRILPGILAGQNFEATITGAPSLLHRPMKRIVEPISLMGVDIKASHLGLPPILIKGGDVMPIDYKMPVPSAQVKSAILLAGLYANGLTTVEEKFKSRDHTERMMEHFGAAITSKGMSVSVLGGVELSARSFAVPGDISSAAFFMVGASILDGSTVLIKDVSVNPTRSGLIESMTNMGAKIKVINRRDLFEPYADIEVSAAETRGITIEESAIPGLIDELPALFVLAAFSKGRTIVKGAGELRVKEADRINSMGQNLRSMGASFGVDGDSIIIEGKESLEGAMLKSFGDHRTCMAMVIAALASKGRSDIDDVSCVSKSFPGFFDILGSLIN